MRVVLGIESGIRNQAIDGGVEDAARGEAEVEEDAGRLGFGLRCDQAGSGPGGLLAEAGAFKHDDVGAIARKAPGDGSTNDATPDDDDFHVASLKDSRSRCSDRQPSFAGI